MKAYYTHSPSMPFDWYRPALEPYIKPIVVANYCVLIECLSEGVQFCFCLRYTDSLHYYIKCFYSDY